MELSTFSPNLCHTCAGLDRDAIYGLLGTAGSSWSPSDLLAERDTVALRDGLPELKNRRWKLEGAPTLASCTQHTKYFVQSGKSLLIDPTNTDQASALDTPRRLKWIENGNPVGDLSALDLERLERILREWTLQCVQSGSGFEPTDHAGGSNRSRRRLPFTEQPCMRSTIDRRRITAIPEARQTSDDQHQAQTTQDLDASPPTLTDPPRQDTPTFVAVDHGGADSSNVIAVSACLPRMRFCFFAVVFECLVIGASLAVGLYYSIVEDQMEGGFTVAEWMVAVGTLLLAAPMMKHYPECKCWIRRASGFMP